LECKAQATLRMRVGVRRGRSRPSPPAPTGVGFRLRAPPCDRLGWFDCQEAVAANRRPEPHCRQPPRL